MSSRTAFWLSAPERALRALFAALGGGVQEAADLVLPRFVRSSRLYEATAKNLLRVMTELVGGVEQPEWATGEVEPDAARLAGRKLAGNVVELGSIAAFGMSPLWLLAAAADVTRGSRVYLDVLVDELRAAGVLRPEADLGSVDDLLAALEGTAGGAARLIDIPPLELNALRRSLEELRADASSLPSSEELDRLYRALRDTAAREQRPLLEVSAGVGLAFFNAARHVGRQHVLDAYTEDLAPVREEGFGAYARRVGRPYSDAIARHFSSEVPSYTERGLAKLRREGDA